MTFGIVGAALVVISLIYWLGMRRIMVRAPTGQ
jgi:hypothetical protein